MNEPEAGSIIQQTFAYVTQVYEETAHLMKDLQAALKKRGFKSLTGNHNGSNGSRQLDWPRQWLPRYVSGYWVKEGGPERGQHCTYLAVTVLFGDLNDQAVEPLLVCGLVQAMDHEQASYQYGWLWDVHFNRDQAFKVTHEDGQPTRFRCEKYGNDSWAWAHSGVLLSRGLTSISGSGDIEALAGQLAALWESQSGLLRSAVQGEGEQ